MGNEMSALRLYLPLVRLGKVLSLQKSGLVSFFWFQSQSLTFLAFVSVSYFVSVLVWLQDRGENSEVPKKVLCKVAALPFL